MSQELGIGPVAAYRTYILYKVGLHMKASILGAAIKNKGYDYRVRTKLQIKECYDDFLTVEMKKLVALVTRGQMLKSRINWRETITRNAVGMMLPSRLFNAQAYVHVAA